MSEKKRYEDTGDSSGLLKLLKAAQAKRKRAWPALVVRVAPRMRAVIVAQGRTDDVEDVLQESLRKAASGIDELQLRSDRNALAWFRKIARHTAIDASRPSLKRTSPAGPDVPHDVVGSAIRGRRLSDNREPTRPSQAAVAAELLQRVARELEALPDNQRELVLDWRIRKLDREAVMAKHKIAEYTTMTARVARTLRGVANRLGIELDKPRRRSAGDGDDT